MRKIQLTKRILIPLLVFFGGVVAIATPIATSCSTNKKDVKTDVSADAPVIGAGSDHDLTSTEVWNKVKGIDSLKDTDLTLSDFNFKSEISAQSQRRATLTVLTNNKKYTGEVTLSYNIEYHEITLEPYNWTAADIAASTENGPLSVAMSNWSSYFGTDPSDWYLGQYATDGADIQTIGQSLASQTTSKIVARTHPNVSVADCNLYVNKGGSVSLATSGTYTLYGRGLTQAQYNDFLTQYSAGNLSWVIPGTYTKVTIVIS